MDFRISISLSSVSKSFNRFLSQHFAALNPPCTPRMNGLAIVQDEAVFGLSTTRRLWSLVT